MRADYILANPSGNITLFVLDQKTADRELSCRLMEKHIGNCEQIGFCVPPISGEDGRLEMMGGEFCGNGARAFGLMLSREKNLHRDVKITVSGCPETLDVQIKDDSASILMPPVIRRLNTEFSAYELKGITHAVLPDITPDNKLSVNIINKIYSVSNPDAVGVMFYNTSKHFLTPYVYVKATDTAVWESSCGSGCVAVTTYLGHGEKIEQPGGFIVTHTENGRVRISGPVTLSERKTIEL